MIVVTGATGHLGRLVVEGLLKKVPAREIVAAVRSPDKARDLAARGVVVRPADYARPETLAGALAGAQQVLLISSSEVCLRAPTSKLGLAAEHKATELAIRGSGLAWTFLRNGWYLENYTENLGTALQHGAIPGCAGGGRIAAASRADYAEAAVTVLTQPGHAGKAYELAGDRAFTMAELAAEVSKQAGKAIAYRDLPPDQYRTLLAGAGLPGPFVDLLVDSDLGIAQGELDDSTGDLRRLIGRPTTPLAAAVTAALRR